MKFSNAIASLCLMATAANGFRDQSQKKKIVDPRHRHLEQICTVDHDKAQSAEELTVDIKAVPDRGTTDPNGLFTITIFDPPYAQGNGLPMSTYGWCIDYDRFISTGEYVMDILSAYDSDVRTDAVDKPDMFPNLAWLINNVNVGDSWEARDGCEGKDAITWYEMQGAVWKLIDDKDGEGTFYKRRRVDCVSEQIAEKARTLGVDYELDCNDPHEQIPLVMIVDHDVTGEILNQVIVSETPLSSIPGMCVCEEPEPEIAPTASPRNFPAPPREDICQDEMREDTCSTNEKCDDNAIDLPMGAIEHWDVNANIGCLALGFDFGFKTGDPGCFDESDSPFKADGNSLEVTNDRGCTDCSMPVDAKYSVTCSNPDGNQFKEATISANVDMYVYVKAQGGYLYKYEAGSTLDVITPGNKAISHMDFCFVCPGPEAKIPSCQDDVLECPDGSFVSRTGANCEFEKCPNPECTADYECPQPMCLPGAPCPYYICQGFKCVAQYPETGAPTEAPETPAPTEAPETPAPTATPKTPAPTEDTENRIVEPPPPTKGSGSGDPHFKTWTGDKYDYHGECDLVLVDNPGFNNGQGLKLHIRTTRVKYFSFIERAALQIGDDVLEFANDAENFLINGKPVEANRKHHKTLLGGFVIRRDKKAVSIRFQYSTHGHARIDFHTRKNGFPAVIVDGAGTDIFQGSLGLLGDWQTGKRIARDGKTELNDEDATAFALEWQVRDTEPMLFKESRFPQFPTTCTPPTKMLEGRLGMTMARKQAEEACAHWKEDKEDCIFDVIATRDVMVAAEGSISHVVA